jgi:hypothetical protein
MIRTRIITAFENTLRIDPHQQALMKYITTNDYGLVCNNLNELAALLTDIEHFVPSNYFAFSF